MERIRYGENAKLENVKWGESNVVFYKEQLKEEVIIISSFLPLVHSLNTFTCCFKMLKGRRETFI
jgi:hypothetical protein